MFDYFSLPAPQKMVPLYPENSQFRNNPQLLNAKMSKTASIAFTWKSCACEGPATFSYHLGKNEL